MGQIPTYIKKISTVDSAHSGVSFKDEMAADAVEILAEIGEPVTWSGKTFPALVSDPGLSEDLGLAKSRQSRVLTPF